MHRRFDSIKHSQTHAYVYDSRAFDMNAAVDHHFRMYETYGDGRTQHSRDWGITREYMADYLYSMAAAMLEDAELASEFLYTLSRRPHVDEIAFCASVIFKPAEGCTMYEKKTRYFSVSQKKVTSSPAKEHDKRYSKVSSAEDGSPASIYRLLLPECARDLERYQWAHAIHAWVTGQDGLYMGLPAKFLGWTKDSDDARQLRDAFECAWNVCEAYRLRCNAESGLENARRNAERAVQSKLLADRQVGETEVEVIP